jgi:hypothetical protein
LWAIRKGPSEVLVLAAYLVDEGGMTIDQLNEWLTSGTHAKSAGD